MFLHPLTFSVFLGFATLSAYGETPRECVESFPEVAVGPQQKGAVCVCKHCPGATSRLNDAHLAQCPEHIAITSPRPPKLVSSDEGAVRFRQAPSLGNALHRAPVPLRYSLLLAWLNRRLRHIGKNSSTAARYDQVLQRNLS